MEERGSLRVCNRWRWGSTRALLLAAVCANAAIWLCVGRAFGGAAALAGDARAAHALAGDARAAFKCVVLTLDASARVDPRCTRFVGTRFREEEFALASAEAD